MEAINWHTFFFLLFALVTCFFAVAVVVARNIVRMAFYLVLSLGATAGLFFLAGADFVAAMQLMIYVGGTLVLLVFGVMLTAQDLFISMKTHAGEWILATIVGGSLLVVLLQTAFSVDDWQADQRFAHPLAVLGDVGTDAGRLVVRAKQPGSSLAGVNVALQIGGSDSKVVFDKNQRVLTFHPAHGTITAEGLAAILAADDGEAGKLFEAWPAPGTPPTAEIDSSITATTAMVGPAAQKTATALGLGLLGQRVDKLQQPDEQLQKGMSGYLLPFEIVSVHLLVVLVGAAYLARSKRRAASQGAA